MPHAVVAPRVIVAPDSFRGSISAADAADAIAEGVSAAWPDAVVRRMGIADGGEGTLDCAVTAGFRSRAITVPGPLGDPVRARIATRGTSAVIELAELCGWPRLPGGRTDALAADTRGLGAGIRAALDLGCDDLLVAVGGSVSTDGGVGMLRALGARAYDRDGNPVDEPGGGQVHRIDRLDVSGLDARLAAATISLATDVDNPVVGPRGAAKVFAPQKGASVTDVAVLERGLTVLADVIARATGVRVHDLPGAGAAGGVGATAMPYLDARVVPGADVVLDLLEFDAAAVAANWVITGEGKWDGQSAGGKAPSRIASRARGAGARVALIAGVVDAGPAELAAAGFAATCALTELQPDRARCMTEARALLTTAGGVVTRRLAEGISL